MPKRKQKKHFQNTSFFKRSEFINKKAIHVLLLTFFFVQFLFLITYSFPFWDEAVYISMAKYIYTGGNSGLFEILRPIFLPLSIGIIWLISPTNLLFLSKLFMLVTATLGLFVLFKLSKEVTDNKTALLACIFLIITPLFFLNSFKILTDTLSSSLALLSLYLFTKRKYSLSGLFSGLAFLTRFTSILFIFVSGFVFFVDFFVNKEKSKKKEIFFSALRFFSLFLIIILPFFISNYFLYKSETSTSFDAIFRPLIYASNTIKDYVWLYQGNIFYYLFNVFKENPLFLFSIIGIIVFLIGKSFKKNKIIFLAMFSFLMYFSLLPHKELRYALSFLPLLALFSAIGVTFSLKFLKIFNKKIKFFLIILLLLFLISPFLKIVSLIKNPLLTEPDEIKDIYLFLQRKPIEGAILTTDPVLGIYVDNKLIPAYYSLDVFESLLKKEDYKAVFYLPSSFPCQETDSKCKNQKIRIVQYLLINHKLVMDKELFGNKYYLFTDLSYFDELPKTDLFIDYGLSNQVVLSKKPQDRLPISMLLEDFPSLNDDRTDIWNKESYYLVKSFIMSNDIPADFVVVPSHLLNLSYSELNYLKNSRNNIVQNGYSHTEELLLPYNQQFSLIKKGKEIINHMTNKEVSVFIPPNYLSGKNTTDILSLLNYSVYISSIGDTEESKIKRYDQTFTLIKNWKENTLKTREEVEIEIKNIRQHSDSLVFSVYYYMYKPETIDELDYFYNLTKNDYYLSVYELYEWEKFISQVNLSFKNNIITLSGPKSNFSKEVTLLFYSSGNYSLISDYNEFYIKNINSNPLVICLGEEQCYNLNSNQEIKLNGI